MYKSIAIALVFAGCGTGTSVDEGQATTTVTIKANLDSTASVPSITPFDPTDANTASACSTFNTSTTLYDGSGVAHQLTIYFSKTGDGAWSFNGITDGGGITGGVAGTPSVIESGTLAFDNLGDLTAVTQSSTFNPIGATQPQPLAFDLGDPTSSGGTGTGGIVQYASSSGRGTGSAATFVHADGHAAGVQGTP